jgi:hypothetical protein
LQEEVIIAFPVTAESVPVLENQWLCAFLPVRQMGFKFLIHAGFDTQANRQGIVETRDWLLALLTLLSRRLSHCKGKSRRCLR